jgi:hypothetical protein
MIFEGEKRKRGTRKKIKMWETYQSEPFFGGEGGGILD